MTGKWWLTFEWRVESRPICSKQSGRVWRKNDVPLSAAPLQIYETFRLMLLLAVS